MAVPPPSPAASDAGDKATLRRAMRADRRAFVARLHVEQGHAAALHAAAHHTLPHIPTGAAVALYRAGGEGGILSGEIDPTPLAVLLAAAGHRLALPHVAADGAAMRFLAWHPDAPLFEGAFGLTQPHDESAPLAPAVIIAPLVAFDRAGGRLGQGGGYYDRAFAAFPDAIRIGYAWSVQEAPALPVDPWDMPLHAVATERAWIACGGRP